MNVNVRIKRLKFLDDPFPGWQRSYWRCKKHGKVAYRDYQPFSLSNPVIGALPCGCSGHPADGQIIQLLEQDGMAALLRQREERQLFH